jgi:hypothetical protein
LRLGVLAELCGDAAQFVASPMLSRFGTTPMKPVPWLILLVLVAAHHDFWFWNDSTLLGGWLPIGLGYHIALSIVAAVFWLFTVKTAWPVDDEAASAEALPEGSTEEGSAT